MKIASLTASLLVLAFAAAQAAEQKPTGQMARQSLMVKGMQRTFLVYTPKSLKPEAPLLDRKSTRLNSSHVSESRMPSSA